MKSQTLKYGLFVLAGLVALGTALGLTLPEVGDRGQALISAAASFAGLLVKLWQQRAAKG